MSQSSFRCASPGAFDLRLIAIREREYEAKDLVEIALPPPMIVAFERHQRRVRNALGDELSASVSPGAVAPSMRHKKRPAEGCSSTPTIQCTKSADDPPSVGTRNTQADAPRVNQAMAALPVAYREVLVLRELEHLRDRPHRRHPRRYDDVAPVPRP